MIELLLADGADIDNQPPGTDVIPLMLAQTPAMAQFLFDARRQQESQAERAEAGAVARLQ